MAISVADNFSYQGGKPLDARMKFDTVALMVATPAASLYDGCFAYVKATKKYYSYDSANETDLTLGKWVEYSSGGGAEYDDFTGATSSTAGAHGLVPAPAIGDNEKYLKGDGTWAEIPMPSFDYLNISPEAMNFSTDEKVIGTWIDGKPLYQKTVDFGVLPDGDKSKTINHNISDIDRIIDFNAIAINTTDNMACKVGCDVTNSNHIGITGIIVTQTVIEIRAFSDRSMFDSTYVTIQYTKTTDTAVASGEKIVGQWIDGKPLYQKTFTGLSISINTSSWTNVVEIPNLKSVVDCIAYYNNSKSIMQYRAVDIDGNYVQLIATDARTLNTITLRYTKTTS